MKQKYNQTPWLRTSFWTMGRVHHGEAWQCRRVGKYTFAHAQAFSSWQGANEDLVLERLDPLLQIMAWNKPNKEAAFPELTEGTELWFVVNAYNWEQNTQILVTSMKMYHNHY